MPTGSPRTDADYHQRDLYESIKRGDYPSWTLKMQIMPFEAARNYRFNPFDLTKVWPHGDYPLIEVGRLTLDRNVTDYHTEIEQAAFEVNNLVPGITLSPDKMLLGPRLLLRRRPPRPARGELQADPGERAGRGGARLQQGRLMRVRNVSDPVYAPNSKGGPAADSEHYKPVGWEADGDMVRSAYTLHAEDDDWGQAGTMVREVLDDAARDRLVSNIAGHLLDGVTEPVLVRAFEYWRNVDKHLGDRVEHAVRASRASPADGHEPGSDVCREAPPSARADSTPSFRPASSTTRRCCGTGGTARPERQAP